MQLSFLDRQEDKLARFIEGSLSLMTMGDLIQWIESSHRTGTLLASNEEISKRFYFQEGKLIFIWSEKEEECLCEAMSNLTGLPIARILEHLRNAEELGISCIGYISSEEGVPLKQLTEMITGLAEKAMAESLTWKTGHFRFSDHLPSTVLSSPVNLNSSWVLLESAVLVDETGLESKANTDTVMDEIFDLIRKGSIDIPPLPSEMQSLMARINDPSLSMEEIIEAIYDPLLVSKILRMCNSPFYGRREKVGTMREAVVYMGLKSLLSIVTVHALSGYSPRNADEIKSTLHHSLLVAMIARQLSRDMGGNFEQAFTCGLLHDIGKVVMLELLTGYDVTRDQRTLLIDRHHPIMGALVAKRWNMGEDIQTVVRHHHDPAQAGDYRQLVEVIYLSDLLAKHEAPPPDLELSIRQRLGSGTPTIPFEDTLAELDQEIETILAPT